jgi:hypothetical protein
VVGGSETALFALFWCNFRAQLYAHAVHTMKVNRTIRLKLTELSRKIGAFATPSAYAETPYFGGSS